jgi:hypothetical protein
LTLLLSRRRILSRRQTLDLLGKLAETATESGRSLYLPPRTSPDEIEKSLEEITLPPDIPAQLAESIAKSPTGGAVFWGDEGKYLVLPPFPVTAKHLTDGFATGPLLTPLKQDHTIALVLVRLGAYAVGVCRGEALIGSKVGTGNIHGRHRKGGSSAHRFERHRDKQIEYFFTRLCQHAREKLEPHAKSLDYLVYGGARTTIRELKKQCEFLGKLPAPELSPLLDIREPRQAVLEDAVRRIWSSTVYQWREAD